MISSKYSRGMLKWRALSASAREIARVGVAAVNAIHFLAPSRQQRSRVAGRFVVGDVVDEAAETHTPREARAAARRGNNMKA